MLLLQLPLPNTTAALSLLLVPMKRLALLSLLSFRRIFVSAQPVDTPTNPVAESINLPAVSIFIGLIVLTVALFGARVAFARYRYQQMPVTPPSLSTAFSFQSQLPTLSAHHYYERKRAVKTSGYLVGMLGLPTLEVHIKTSSDAIKWRKNRYADSRRTSFITKLHLDSRRRANRATMYLEDFLRFRTTMSTTRASTIEDTFSRDPLSTDARGDISRTASLRLVSTPISRPISLELPLPCISTTSFAFDNLGPSASMPLAPSVPENLLRQTHTPELVKFPASGTLKDCEIQQPQASLRHHRKSPLFSLFDCLDATSANIECRTKDDVNYGALPLTPPQLHVFSPSCRILHLDIQDTTHPNLASLSEDPSTTMHRISSGSFPAGRTIPSLPCSVTLSST